MAPTEELTEYERERLAKIERNKALMERLALAKLASEAGVGNESGSGRGRGRGRGAARARHFASSVDAARVSEKHSRAQAFAHPSRAVRHPRLSPVCAHRASVARVARRGFRPVLPGVAIARANAESHDTGNIPPESARGCRARALLAATLPRIGSPRVFFRTLPVTPRRNLTPSSPPRPSLQCLSPLAFARRNRSRKRTETRSPRCRSARPSHSFFRPSRYARAPPNSDPNASRAFRARARGRAVRRERLFARARLAR